MSHWKAARANFGAVAQVQFLPDAVAVGLDRLGTQVQSLSNLMRVEAVAD